MKNFDLDIIIIGLLMITLYYLFNINFNVLLLLLK